MSIDPRNGYITRKQGEDFEVLRPLLRSLYNEFQELSKKKPQEIVSSSKVKMVNRVLEPILTVLDKEPSRGFLEAFDEDDLPQNSDVILMLGQAIAAMNSFRERHRGSRGWNIEPQE